MARGKRAHGTTSGLCGGSVSMPDAVAHRLPHTCSLEAHDGVDDANRACLTRIIGVATPRAMRRCSGARPGGDAAAATAGFRHAGTEPQQRAAFMLPTSPECFDIHFGILLAGRFRGTCGKGGWRVQLAMSGAAGRARGAFFGIAIKPRSAP